jgi:hypothetical protein
MTILTRQERERFVIELYYNQGKTYREISKEARISFRDIGLILNKEVEEKKRGIERRTTTVQLNCFYYGEYYSSDNEGVKHADYEYSDRLCHPIPG